MRKSFSVLIPDGESHLLIYVVNSLSQIKGIKIYVMANTKYLPIRFSRYLHHFSYYPKTNNPLDWISNINHEVEKNDIDLIMPIFEEGIEAIIKFKEKIDSTKLCLLSAYNDFQTANNKWLLAQHVVTNNISAPKSFLCTSTDSKNKTQFKFPVIVKPIVASGGGDGVFLFKKKEDLFNYIQGYKLADNLLVQEYVEGFDIGCSVLCKSGTILAFTMQKATLLNSNPFKPLLGVEFVYNKELFKTVEKLMQSLNWSGVAHIDLKFDIVTETFKLIEINPRFWGSLDASLSAGVNFPYLYCLASFDEHFHISNYKHIEYLNLKGFFKKLIKNKSLIFDFDFILNNTQLKYMFKDPLPTILKYSIFMKNILASGFKKKLKMLQN
jgi:predicted ATP-grasp superfamily ATP-dependent carboligase